MKKKFISRLFFLQAVYERTIKSRFFATISFFSTQKNNQKQCQSVKLNIN